MEDPIVSTILILYQAYFSGNLKIDEKTDGFGGIDAKIGLFGKITEAFNFGFLVKTPSKLETKGTRKTDYNTILNYACSMIHVKM